MCRLLLFVLAFHVPCVSAAIGSDYLLRIDELEQAVEPASVAAPREFIVCSIEVVARPGFPFHGRVTIRSETVSVAGRLRPADSGKFVAEFEFEHAVDTGESVVGGDGTKIPVVDRSFVQTGIATSVGSSVTFNGLVVKDAKTRRQIRYRVTLARYKHLDD